MKFYNHFIWNEIPITTIQLNEITDDYNVNNSTDKRNQNIKKKWSATGI